MSFDLGLAKREVAIAGFAELPRVRRGDRSATELAGSVFSDLCGGMAISPAEIDGLVVTAPMSEADHPFWSNAVADVLGLEPRWLQVNDLGGASSIANVARAALAILGGVCETVLCLSVDASSTQVRGVQTGHKTEFADPAGYAGPLSAFGLLASAYHARYGYPAPGLARLAVAQREGALSNPHTVAELRKPITVEDYAASRVVASPLRVLDCVMPCDGGSAVLVTSTRRAQALAVAAPIHPVAYRELTNFAPAAPAPEMWVSGFSVVGPGILEAARLNPGDVCMFQPYDDFLIAVALQLEQFGFCEAGRSGAFLLQTDIGPRGTLPINTGGGQISGGQPGLAGGSVNLIEALIQLTAQAKGRQISDPTNAVVTGIGSIQYARNWGTSNALVLAR